MTSKRAAIAMSLTVAAAVLAGCGGGSSSSIDPAASATRAIGSAKNAATTADNASARSAGAVPQADVSFTGGVLGTPDSVDTTRNATVLGSLDRLGTPKDIFRAQVKEAVNSGPTTNPTTTAPTSTTPTTTDTTPTTTAAPEINPLQADFDVDGEPILAREGDSIPPDTQQFLVKTIARSGVTLVLNGGLLPNGSDTLKLSIGQSIILRNQTAGESYRIRLAGIANSR